MVPDELAPGLLLAAPSLRDPNFEKSVVLLGRHGADGALGWVINGRELMSLRELFATSELVADGATVPENAGFARVACLGGPVAPAAGWLVYRRSAKALPGEIRVGAELGVSGERAAFAVLLAGNGPSDFRLLLGCAGWGPGQLEAEIGAGAWLPASIDVALVFDASGERSWNTAYHLSVGAAPATFTSRRGKA